MMEFQFLHLPRFGLEASRIVLEPYCAGMSSASVLDFERELDHPSCTQQDSPQLYSTGFTLDVFNRIHSRCTQWDSVWKISKRI